MVARIADVSHVTYGIPDLDKQEAFLTDFGLVRVERTAERLLVRGTGPAPYVAVLEKAAAPVVKRIAFRVAARTDLEAAAKIAGAGKIEGINLPGGGERVALTDPEGIAIELVHGIAPVDPLPLRRPMRINHADEKNRKGGLQRLDRGPAQPMRLGHVLIFVTDLARTMSWYQTNFGLLLSDSIYEGTPDNMLGAFLRCDRGAEYTDHHTLGIFKAPTAKLHHASFEIQDFDAQYVGSEWLSAKGWTHEWGVGRHVLGSQVFDYWRDPYNQMWEHFTDGDLLTSDVKAGHHEAGPNSLFIWGPSVPETFFA